MRKIERIILRTKPFAYMLTKSKALKLPGFGGVPVYDAFKFFFLQIKKISLNERAAAISFNFLMAIPALFIFLLTLIPYLPLGDIFHNELLHLASDIAPNENSFELIHGLLDDFLNTPRGGLLSFGFLLVIFYSSNAMMGIIRTFDRSLPVIMKTNFLKKRLRAIRLTVVILFLLVATILALSGQDWIFRQIMAWLDIQNSSTKWWIKTLRWLVIITLFLYSVSLIYKYAPSVQKRGRLLTPGAFFATLLIIITTWGFSLWVNAFGNLNKIYGSIGTVMILMIFIFLNSLILLIGFELNMSIQYLKAKADERKNKEMSELLDQSIIPKLGS